MGMVRVSLVRTWQRFEGQKAGRREGLSRTWTAIRQHFSFKGAQKSVVEKDLSNT